MADADGGTAPGEGPLAVDLGCGDGTDTLALLDAGWRVHAVDASPDFPDYLAPRVEESVGPQDSWHGRPGITTHSRDAVDALLSGLTVVRLEEQREDGWSCDGEKHWHRWHVLARASTTGGTTPRPPTWGAVETSDRSPGGAGCPCRSSAAGWVR